MEKRINILICSASLFDRSDLASRIENNTLTLPQLEAELRIIISQAKGEIVRLFCSKDEDKTDKRLSIHNIDDFCELVNDEEFDVDHVWITYFYLEQEKELMNDDLKDKIKDILKNMDEVCEQHPVTQTDGYLTWKLNYWLPQLKEAMGEGSVE